jgi:hypothetical protein
VDYAALRHDRSRDVTDEAVQKIEEAGLAETLGDDGRRFQSMNSSTRSSMRGRR